MANNRNVRSFLRQNLVKMYAKTYQIAPFFNSKFLVPCSPCQIMATLQMSPDSMVVCRICYGGRRSTIFQSGRIACREAV